MANLTGGGDSQGPESCDWPRAALCLTFLQGLDLVLGEAGPVPLQLPLQLQVELRLLPLVPLHALSAHMTHVHILHHQG